MQSKHDKINANHVRVELLIRNKYHEQLYKNDWFRLNIIIFNKIRNAIQ